jgi:hypothetical protein
MAARMTMLQYSNKTGGWVGMPVVVVAALDVELTIFQVGIGLEHFGLFQSTSTRKCSNRRARDIIVVHLANLYRLRLIINLVLLSR